MFKLFQLYFIMEKDVFKFTEKFYQIFIIKNSRLGVISTYLTKFQKNLLAFSCIVEFLIPFLTEIILQGSGWVALG